MAGKRGLRAGRVVMAASRRAAPGAPAAAPGRRGGARGRAATSAAVTGPHPPGRAVDAGRRPGRSRLPAAGGLAGWIAFGRLAGRRRYPSAADHCAAPGPDRMLGAVITPDAHRRRDARRTREAAPGALAAITRPGRSWRAARFSSLAPRRGRQGDRHERDRLRALGRVRREVSARASRWRPTWAAGRSVRRERRPGCAGTAAAKHRPRAAVKRRAARRRPLSGRRLTAPSAVLATRSSRTPAEEAL